MRNNTLFTVIALLITATAWAQDPATIGSISYNNVLGAYEINSADNLRDLAVYVNGTGDYSTGGSETTAHKCVGQTFKMTADITLATTTPISTTTVLKTTFPASAGVIPNDSAARLTVRIIPSAASVSIETTMIIRACSVVSRAAER